MVTSDRFAVHRRLSVNYNERRLEPNAIPGGVALQRIIRFLIHMIEEVFKPGQCEINVAPHGGGAIRISGNIATSANLCLELRNKPTAAQFRKCDHSCLRMRLKNYRELLQKVRAHRMAVVVQTHHDI